ncbi:hypothetical protein TUM17387_25540 [Shewanella carassii]|nr:hypothetical protein TUM17387_25540 [Shewanella carassii]
MLPRLPGTKPVFIYIEFKAKHISFPLADSRLSLGQVSLEHLPEVAIQANPL